VISGIFVEVAHHGLISSIFIGWLHLKILPAVEAYPLCRSLNRSRFKIAFDYFSKLRMNLHLLEPLFDYSTVNILMILMTK
jgi:hypothetical protein